MRFRFLIVILSMLMAVSPAKAEMLATFYTHDFDATYFPHAFIRLQGTIEETGEVIDTNYGFTAKSTTPAILFGSVRHMMETKKLKYVEKSDAHFTLRLDDDGYAKLMTLMEKWRDMPGKGYNLGKRNCVHFAMEAAVIFGIEVNRKSKFFKKPKSFMEEVMQLNPDLALIKPSAQDALGEPVQIASKPVE
ncbi:MAG: hypothetical protein V3V15_04020 [Sphingorhabdus sp.]